MVAILTFACNRASRGQQGEELAHESDHELVDLLDMTPDRMLDLVGGPGGPLADATLWHLEVVEAGALTPTLHRVVLTAPGLDGLHYMPGQDLMLRVPQGSDRVVNRRYTIRSFDATRAAVFIDVSLHGAGPGTDWIRGARIGDQIEAIGPHGKITFREHADWHLFVGDETGLPGALAMIEALPSASRATALLEIDTPADEQRPDSRETPLLDLHWLHRSGRSAPGDASLILEALAGVALPDGLGHAYPQLKPEWCGVSRSAERGPHQIRFRPRRIGDAASLTPSTESRPAGTERHTPERDGRRRQVFTRLLYCRRRNEGRWK